MNKQEQRSGFVGPFILVGIGILFLLNNLGLIEVNFWRLAATLWPVILIGIGLDMLIGKRSTAGSWMALLLTAILLVGGAVLVGVGPGAANQGEVTEIRYAPGPVSEADIHISTSTGRLTLGSMADGGVLVEGTVRLAGQEELVEDQKTENGSASYRLRSDGVGVVGLSGNESVWDLRISGEVPTQLEVNTGVGEVDLRLERLQLTGLKADLGIGATTITLPRSGIFTGNISGGIGKLVIRVPDSLAVRLAVKTGIGQVQMGDGFIASGDNVYLSKAAQQGGTMATLEVSSGIGQVVVERVAEE